MTRNRLYSFLFLVCLAGYVWLFYFMYNTSTEPQVFGKCMMKHTLGIPCPSCGTTRSVSSLLEGDIVAAWQWNPFGFIVAVFMLVLPIWILWDVFRNSSSLWRSYQKLEARIKTPVLASVLIIMVLANWIWNFYKEV
jgi:hypothetical protein